ncbi:hypothetical protein BJ546DRAFT_55786 [Cryomyces antarcticus]
MSLIYKKVLVIGATSGIGEALAAKLVDNGTKVIVSGRRQDKLAAFVSKHSKDKAEAIAFDITKLDAIPQFAADVTKAHPELDCVILHSGIQRGFDFTKPANIDLSTLGEELTTNHLSFVHLTVAFLPHLQKHKNETALIYTTSGLGLVPMVRCANYCATKAALHHFILVLREQMSDGPGNVKVIEIFPPAVQTELHDEKHQPDIKNGGQIGMPLDEFTDETYKGLLEGKDQIPVGMSKDAFEGFELKRQEIFKRMTEGMKKMMAQHSK